jgi:hypothetical protein
METHSRPNGALTEQVRGKHKGSFGITHPTNPRVPVRRLDQNCTHHLIEANIDRLKDKQGTWTRMKERYIPPSAPGGFSQVQTMWLERTLKESETLDGKSVVLVMVEDNDYLHGDNIYKVCLLDANTGHHLFRTVMNHKAEWSKNPMPSHSQGWFVDCGKGGLTVRLRADASFWVRLASFAEVKEI